MQARSRGAVNRAPRRPSVLSLGAVDDVRSLGIGALALALAGCGGPRLLMRDANSREIAPPSEGRARIVFALPEAYRDVVSFVDDRGQYLGQLGSRTYFQVEVRPGPRRFYALVGASEHTVRGTLEPGRTYWVLAETGFARPFRLFAWAPECGEDPMARLAGVRAVEPDPQADPGGLLARQLGDLPQRILEADAEFEAMSEADRMLRTLRPACTTSAEQTGASAPVADPAP